MKVICPECEFASEIPEDKIPANAQLATCPRCQVKFRFRNLDDSDQNETQVEKARAATSDEGFPPQQAPAESAHSYYQESDQLEEEISYSEETIQEQTDAEKDSDIWKSLDSMSPEEKISRKNNATEEEYDESNDHEVPFEVMEKYGFFPAFFLTIKKVILSPTTFFKDMPLKGFLMPLVFFVLLAEFQEVCNFIWATAGVDTSIGSDVGEMVGNSIIANSLNEGSASAILSLFLYPLMLAALSFPVIGITHIMLMVFGAGDRGYQATFRATAYSYAPIILCIFPIVGDMIGAMAVLVVSIIAYKSIHNTTYLRVVLAMLMPLVLLLVIFGFFSGFNQPTL